MVKSVKHSGDPKELRRKNIAVAHEAVDRAKNELSEDWDQYTQRKHEEHCARQDSNNAELARISASMDRTSASIHRRTTWFAVCGLVVSISLVIATVFLGWATLRAFPRPSSPNAGARTDASGGPADLPARDPRP
jgi:hypothetical protein